MRVTAMALHDQGGVILARTRRGPAHRDLPYADRAAIRTPNIVSSSGRSRRDGAVGPYIETMRRSLPPGHPVAYVAIRAAGRGTAGHPAGHGRQGQVMSHYSDGDPLCDACGLMFPPGWDDGERFHRPWPFGDFHVCEQCLQSLILACDLQPVARDARAARDQHARALAVISDIEHGRGMAA